MNQDPIITVDGQEEKPFSVQKLTRMHVSLTQILEQNTNLRMKYPDQPQKFYQSQEQLNNLIEQLSELTQQQIPMIIESKILVPLIKILEHPNIDLGIAMIELMYELMQEQPSDDKIFQKYFRMAIWLVQNSFLESIVAILAKLDEQNNIQEYQIGLKILKLIEIISNLHEPTYELLVQDKKIIEYLANRIMPNFVVKHKLIDDNKYVSTDILIAILTNSQKAQNMFSAYSGVQILLQSIAVYETKLPQHNDEKQALSNLFSCLAVLLINHTIPNNKKVFHELKGNYLMISFLKSKSEYSHLALKVMAVSLNSLNLQQEVKVVHQIIQDGGLKYIFVVFRRKGLRGDDIDQQKIIDQNCLLLIYSMLRSSENVFKDRLLHKIAENRFQNLQRLFEVRAQYSQNVGKQLEEEIKQASQYLSRINQGLSLIQTVDKILLVIVQKYSKLRAKLKNFMQIYGLRVKDVEKTLTDHYTYLGVQTEKKYVQYMLSNNLIALKNCFLTSQKLDQNQEKIAENKN